MTTGILFGLIFVTHFWRMAAEPAHWIGHPVPVLLTLAAGAMGLWAALVLRRSARQGPAA